MFLFFLARFVIWRTFCCLSPSEEKKICKATKEKAQQRTIDPQQKKLPLVLFRDVPNQMFRFIFVSFFHVCKSKFSTKNKFSSHLLLLQPPSTHSSTYSQALSVNTEPSSSCSPVAS